MSMTIEHFLSQPVIFKWDYNGGEYYIKNLQMLEGVSTDEIAVLKEKLNTDYICLSFDYTLMNRFDREVYIKKEVLSNDSCQILPDCNISIDGENISKRFSFSRVKRPDALRFLSEFGYKFSDDSLRRFRSEIREIHRRYGPYYGAYDSVLDADLDLFICCKNNNDFEPFQLLAEVI